MAAEELFDPRKAYKREMGETAATAKNNIMGELRAHSSWVPAPREGLRRHRFSIPGEKGSRFIWWAVDWDQLAPEMRDILEEVWMLDLERPE